MAYHSAVHDSFIYSTGRVGPGDTGFVHNILYNNSGHIDALETNRAIYIGWYPNYVTLFFFAKTTKMDPQWSGKIYFGPKTPFQHV